MATAVILIVLIVIRGVLALRGAGRLRDWWKPIVVGVVELIAVGAWPAVIRITHARSMLSSSPRDVSQRLHAVVQGMAPYLHVFEFALPLAVIGGLVLWGARRAGGMANDLWAWAAVASGLIVVGGSYTTQSGSVQDWLETTVHRVTEFPALAGWWIVAMWAVVASGALVAGRDRPVRPEAPLAIASDADPTDPDPTPVRRSRPPKSGSPRASR